jgi:dTDP-D-glucose 4,6-dehydratase
MWRFIYVSTGEVYGSLEAPIEADEKYSLRPSGPYSVESGLGSAGLGDRYTRVQQLRSLPVSPRS